MANSNLTKDPDRNSKRGLLVHNMRRHAEENTGASAEEICAETFAASAQLPKPFPDLRQVQEYYRWALRDGWVEGLPPLGQLVVPGPISIKDPEVGLLARKYAARLGKTVTQAIADALRAALGEK